METNEKKLSRAARIKLARSAKRTAKKRAIKRKLLAKRMKSPAKLKKVADKAAKNILVKKLAGGKKYQELSLSQKEFIDKKLATKTAVIDKISRKLLPKVKQKEKERIKKVRGKLNNKNAVNENKHGVFTLGINGSKLEVSAHYINGKLKPFSFKSKKEAIQHKKKVGGKIFQSPKTELYYVEFTKLDGPITEENIDDIEIKNTDTGRNIKLSTALNYDEDEPVYKKAMAIVSKTKDTIKNKIPKKQAIKNGIKDFFKKASTEKDETIQSMKILSKYAKGKEVSDEEKKYVADQFKDVLKMSGMAAVASAPGGSIAVPLLVKAAKKMNINLMPSAFQTENFSIGDFKMVETDYTKNDSKHIAEKSVSKSQQRLFGMVHAYNKGDLKKNDVDTDLYTKIKKIANGMTKKDAKKMAKTDHDDLPNKVPTNEGKEEQDNLKDLKAILDVAKMLSDKSPYFKGRGSKKEYIKMLVHKIQKLSESKKQKLLTKMDAYKKVRKPTMPKSIPMKNKKAYDRKDFKKGKYD